MRTKVIGNAERFGRWVGRGWRRYRSFETKFTGGLKLRGMSKTGVIAVLWIFRFILLGAMFYLALWLTLLLVFIVVLFAALANGTSPYEEDELVLPSDYSTKLRKSSGYDPNPLNDSSHEMYVDE